MDARFSDVLVIGSGPSGLVFSAVAAKNKSVTLLEKESKVFKLGKRILVSGNGRANFFNENLLKEENYTRGMLSSLRGVVFDDGINYASSFMSYLTEELKFPYLKEGDLYYPFFNRAESLHNVLVTETEKRKVDVIKGQLIKINPLEKTCIYMTCGHKETIRYNTLVLALGGVSLDRSEDDIFPLKDLHLKRREFSPCLCPVKVKERIPNSFKKNRLKGKLSLYINDEVAYSEYGELIFKDDGISGICVFDSTLYINNALRKDNNSKIKYVFDYLYGADISDISKDSLPLFLKEGLKDNELFKPLTFTFDSFYSFKDSQISYGGILLEEVDKKTMRLNKYKDIIVLGEMLDQNFICGGYNMGMAFIEGYKAARRLDYVFKN